MSEKSDQGPSTEVAMAYWFGFAAQDVRWDPSRK